MIIEVNGTKFKVGIVYEELVKHNCKASCEMVICEHIKDCDECPFNDDDFKEIELV
ncbi:MAG: hypothetical protein ACRDA3_00045 [Peptostreptococcaceae bacterium]